MLNELHEQLSENDGIERNEYIKHLENDGFDLQVDFYRIWLSRIEDINFAK